MGFDLFVVLVLFLCTLRGGAKGSVWQLATICSLVCCFLMAKSASQVIAPWVPISAPLNLWVSMIIIYLVISLLVFLVAGRLKKLLEKAKFGEYDRHLGSVLGFLTGAVICLVVTFFAVTLSETSREHVMKARSGYLAAIVMNQLEPVLPAELQKVLGPYLKALETARNQNFESLEETEPPTPNSFANLETQNSGEKKPSEPRIEEPEIPASHFRAPVVSVDPPANSMTFEDFNNNDLRRGLRGTILLLPGESQATIWSLDEHEGKLTGTMQQNHDDRKFGLLFEDSVKLGPMNYFRVKTGQRFTAMPQLLPGTSINRRLMLKNPPESRTQKIAGGYEHRALLDPGMLDLIRGIEITPTADFENLSAPFEYHYLMLDRYKTLGLGEFETAESFDQWQTENLNNLRIRDSLLEATSATEEPVLVQTRLGLNTDEYNVLEIRMRVPGNSAPQLFWATDGNDFTTKRRVTLPELEDDGLHTYQVDMHHVRGWSGNLTGLKLQPVSDSGQRFAIDYIRALSIPARLP